MAEFNTYKDLPDMGAAPSDEELKEMEGKFEPLPAGEYRAKVEGFEIKTSNKNGLPYINFKLRVFNNSKGRIVFNSYYPFHESQVCKNMFHGFLTALGFTKKMREDFRFNKHLPVLCGLGLSVKLVIEPYVDKNGEEKVSNKVRSSKALDVEDTLRLTPQQIKERIEEFEDINAKTTTNSEAGTSKDTKKDVFD